LDNKQETHSHSRAFFHTTKGSRLGLFLAQVFYWAGMAAVIPYLSVFYESIHLKGGQIGQLHSIPMFVSLFSSVGLAFLSDRLRQHKRVLLVCILGLVAALFVIPQLSAFTALVPVILMYSIFNTPIIPILDQMILSALDDPGNYGRIRVGGSIGWGIMVIATGYLIDRLQVGLSFIFYIDILLLSFLFILILFLPHEETSGASSRESVTLQKLIGMLKQPGFLIFLLIIIIWGFGQAAIDGFLFLHIKHLGGSASLMGISMSVSLIGEIIVFLFSSRIQRRIGTMPMVLLAFVVLFAWLVGLSLIRDPNAIPFFQIFGGSGFALLHSGSVAYVNSRAPKGLGTTAQAIRGGTFSGVGVGFGVIFSGWIYEVAGSAILFRNMAFITLGGFLFALLVFLNQRKSGKLAG
jgi:PPP family 3-phenylpropionic acid transporter